jgi:hypothetical protein
VNCKPGDLAIVVRVLSSDNERVRALSRLTIGRCVKVIRVEPGALGRPTWWIEEPFLIEFEGVTRRVIGLEDETLLSISGIPGSEEDETTTMRPRARQATSVSTYHRQPVATVCEGLQMALAHDREAA